MGEPAERIFTGWHRPFFDLAIPAWIEHVKERGIDPATCVLVLPGRRAARGVEERLAELAPPEWPAPRIVTEGDLPAELARRRRRFATGWQRSLAWRRGVERTPAEVLEQLWRGAAELPIGSLARACASTFRELAAEGLEASGVAERATRTTSLGPAERWSALAQIVAAAREELAERGVVDPAAAAMELASSGDVRDDLRVHLLGVVELARAQRALLERVRATAFVFAPGELGGEFDELGALRVERWSERDLDVPLERWRAVEGPDEQARAALAHLARLAPPPRPEEITLGIADPAVLPYLERRLLESDCEPRWAGGRPLSDSRAAQLLAAVMHWLDAPTAEHFAAVVRHPDVEAALGLAPGTIGSAFDDYSGEHVPARVDGEWLATERRETQERARLLADAHARLGEWLGEFGRDRRLSSADWAECIAAWLARAWPEIDRGALDRDEWAHARAVEALAEIVNEARDADGGRELALDARAALETLAECLESRSLPSPPAVPSRPMVELLGWLELALDDAEHLVVTGANEGSLPERPKPAGLLFEASRRELGLAHEARRVARDAYALSAILASRPGALILSGRRSAQHDPLVPSRLLFRGRADDVVARVRRAWPQHEAELPPPSDLGPRPALPIVAHPPVERMSVTWFARYLRSPYQFYVAHVLGLSSRSDGAVELDRLRFGSLAHTVLERFGTSELRDSTDEGLVRQFLRDTLSQVERERFGNACGPSVRLQIAQLRRRLDAFAQWQAKEVQEGWRIARVEVRLAGKELDGMPLVGFADRVDHHDDRRSWRILDYKTSDAGKDARKVHGGPGAWKDLQLPLYRFLAEGAEFARDAAPRLGFVQLHKEEAGCKSSELGLTQPEYDDALAEARRIVGCVRKEEFTDPGEAPLDDPILAGLCGFALAGELGSDDEDDEEAGG